MRKKINILVAILLLSVNIFSGNYVFCHSENNISIKKIHEPQNACTCIHDKSHTPTESGYHKAHHLDQCTDFLIANNGTSPNTVHLQGIYTHTVEISFPTLTALKYDPIFFYTISTPPPSSTLFFPQTIILLN